MRAEGCCDGTSAWMWHVVGSTRPRRLVDAFTRAHARRWLGESQGQLQAVEPPTYAAHRALRHLPRLPVSARADPRARDRRGARAHRLGRDARLRRRVAPRAALLALLPRRGRAAARRARRRAHAAGADRHGGREPHLHAPAALPRARGAARPRDPGPRRGGHRPRVPVPAVRRLRRADRRDARALRRGARHRARRLARRGDPARRRLLPPAAGPRLARSGAPSRGGAAPRRQQPREHGARDRPRAARAHGAAAEPLCRAGGGIRPLPPRARRGRRPASAAARADDRAQVRVPRADPRRGAHARARAPRVGPAHPPAPHHADDHDHAARLRLLRRAGRPPARLRVRRLARAGAALRRARGVRGEGGAASRGRRRAAAPLDGTGRGRTRPPPALDAALRRTGGAAVPVSRALLAALALGVGLRAVRLAEHPFLHPDGPAYLALAHGPTTLAGYYPPLYPAAVRLAHAAGLGWEAAGRAVSFAAGAATIPGTEAGGPAAVLAAVHPGLVHASAEVLAESLSGLAVGLWALLLFGGQPRARKLAAAGLVAGLAGLVRPEGIALVPLTALGAAAGAPRGSRLARAVVPLLAAAAVVGPLIVSASQATGGLAITGKEAPVVARKYGVAASGVAALVLRHPRAFLRIYPRELARQTLLTLGAVHGLLVLPLVAGLVVAPARARRARLLVLAVLGATTLGVPTIATGKRYVLPLLPLLLPWMAPGWQRLAARLSAGGRHALAAVVLAGLALQGAWPPERTTERCYRETCAFVARRVGPPPASAASPARTARTSSSSTRAAARPADPGSRCAPSAARADGGSRSSKSRQAASRPPHRGTARPIRRHSVPGLEKSGTERIQEDHRTHGPVDSQSRAAQLQEHCGVRRRARPAHAAGRSKRRGEEQLLGCVAFRRRRAHDDVGTRAPRPRWDRERASAIARAPHALRDCAPPRAARRTERAVRLHGSRRKRRHLLGAARGLRSFPVRGAGRQPLLSRRRRLGARRIRAHPERHRAGPARAGDRLRAARVPTRLRCACRHGILQPEPRAHSRSARRRRRTEAGSGRPQHRRGPARDGSGRRSGRAGQDFRGAARGRAGGGERAAQDAGPQGDARVRSAREGRRKSLGVPCRQHVRRDAARARRPRGRSPGIRQRSQTRHAGRHRRAGSGDSPGGRRGAARDPSWRVGRRAGARHHAQPRAARSPRSDRRRDSRGRHGGRTKRGGRGRRCFPLPPEGPPLHRGGAVAPRADQAIGRGVRLPPRSGSPLRWGVIPHGGSPRSSKVTAKPRASASSRGAFSPRSRCSRRCASSVNASCAVGRSNAPSNLPPENSAASAAWWCCSMRTGIVPPNSGRRCWPEHAPHAPTFRRPSSWRSLSSKPGSLPRWNPFAGSATYRGRPTRRRRWRTFKIRRSTSPA